MHTRRFNFSVDLDYAFFYPDLSGAWKVAYERASEWLLEYLGRMGLKITFFICPENVAMFPDYTRRLVQAGHTLGLHIHSIELHTPPDQRDRILREGIDRIAEFSGTKPYQFRAGMFYLDRDMVERLDGLGFTMDSSLVPGRYRPQCEVKETRCFSFNMPVDYRGFPAHPYRLTQNIVEVPLSPYCQDWLNPQSMWQACLNESTGLSILYNHAKNTGDGALKESFDGRFRVGMSEVISKLMDEGFQYVSYDKLMAEIEDQTCSGVLERLPRGAASIA